MPPPNLRRAGRLVVLGSSGLLAGLVLTAAPAAAHGAGGGAVGAPSWLLAYGGVAVVLITAFVLRAWWPTPRLARFDPARADPARPTPLAGGLAGIGLLALVLVAAVAGPPAAAANVAPWAVAVVFWVGLPLAGVLLGDVFRWINPFVTLVRLVERHERSDDGTRAPSWIPAAFLFSFAWYLLAYYRPGSPRALATFLAVYVAAAIGLGLRWGHRWLAAGEGFGTLSTAVARLSPRGGRGPLPRGVALLMVVWLGSTTFDLLTRSSFWIDVLGSSRGWGRTLLDTLGLVWMTAIVGGLYLAVVWVAERGQDQRVRAALGVAVVPLAAGWFLAHDLTLLLTEGQNAYILMSDPLGKGWDLFGTINHTIDYRLLEEAWVGWIQLACLLAGHVATLVVFHDTSLRVLRRRAAARATWATATVLSASIALGTVLVVA